ncbi:protein FAR-RED IMPAIRED RESPONSE 1-like [Impatiens glandulifera]|uniref:protein FAR-RED IMPAIRED RESPONSE 1-like n=1 Tax=Impatiens glandulifera TaxID=253017 RepID=UPI001FB190C0|nr:protein FAR-RED IMPAIRED RESPONSE 1-like [Impatiens glandulifera]
MLYCEIQNIQEEGPTHVFDVLENILGSAGETLRDVWLKVHYTAMGNFVQCQCKMFEFRGILCRHILMVYRRMKVDQVPERYVLDRWRKDLKRGYQSITNIYDSDVSESQRKRYNSLTPMMHLFQQLASQSEDKTSVASRLLEDMIQKLMLDFDNASTSSTPATTPPTEKVIHSPVRVRARGRPPTKRKLSVVEKVINSSKHSTKKKMRDEPTDAQQFNDPATIPQTIVSTQFSFTTLL